ncbi:MAG: MerR family transcriptional regulator [Bacteroidales bacterium]|nr:MerR family transcriptional regulator [Bacteroidales bacterium]
MSDINEELDQQIPLPESFNDEDRLYYSIGETAEIFHVPVSTIRFWSNEFSNILKPRTNKKGNRYFSKNDISILRTIYYLTRVKGLSIQKAKEAMKHDLIHEADNATIVASLLEIKDVLLRFLKILED